MPHRSQAAARRRARLAVTGCAVVVLLVLVGGGVALHEWGKPHPPAPVAGCSATALGGTFGFSLEQGLNATTIAGVGKRRGLPDHAVTVALATALQESKLINLSGGDRDSVGLFQQRPSQGWGPPAKLQDPVYASGKFYAKLVSIPGWQGLPVTVAAQRVQRSGAPDAYADWEPQARTMAAALTGERSAGFTCRFTDTGPAATTSLSTAMSAELGGPALGERVSLAQGWTMACWLVAHGDAYRLASISFAGRTWTRASGVWRSDPKASPTAVSVTRQTSS